jgi:RNA polymerase sigma factor (sigma-70 family)
VESAQLEDVYSEHLESVWRYVRARISDHHEAQDVTSDVFARAVHAWPRFDPAKGSVGAWLMGIAHHAVTDWLRRNRTRGRRRVSPAPDDILEGRMAAAPDPEEAVIREDMLTELRDQLEELGERERHALALRFAAGLRAREVGEVLGISEGAAKMLVWRAVQRLREVIPHE